MPNTRPRPPAVAGRFYPAEPERLEAEVKQYLNAAAAPEDCLDPPLVKAIIAPHAGYPYSGPIAATAYLQLACSDVPVRRFVLVGPAHFAPVRGLVLSGASAFDTPLGRVPVDDEARAAVLALPGVEVDDIAHRPEHCLEVQLPFLQTLFPDFTIVPLLVGDTTPEEVAAVLERLWHGPETLREDSACGRAAAAGLLLAARRRAMHAELVDLRSSGDTGGPPDRVVGYGAFTFVETVEAVL